jgi:hypothetical protein
MAPRAMGDPPVWLFHDPSNHPATACGRCFPSLSKEGSAIASFRERNELAEIGR